MGRSGVLVHRPPGDGRLSVRPLAVLFAVLAMVLSLTVVSSAPAVSAARTLVAPGPGRAISTTTSVGAISGTVTDVGGGGLAGVQVNLSSDALPDRLNAARTAPDGSYTVSGLPVGTDYRVCFTAAGATGGSSDAVGYLGQCYDSLPVSGSSTPVSVPLDKTRTGVNAVLAVGGALSGTVTEAGGSQHGLSNIGVSVKSRSTPATWSAGTAADGSYTVTGLPSGDDYRVCFTAAGATGGGSDGVGYLDRCYDNQPTSGKPTPVTVAQGATRSGINAALAVGGAVSGTVTDAGVTPRVLADVQVQVSSPSTGAGGSATTNANGSYTVTGLPAGTDYTVCFDPSGATGGSSDTSGYLERCWRNQPISAAPTPVSVALGSARTGISAALGVGGAISGTVTDAAGTRHGLANVGVNVGSASTWGAGWAVTDDKGSYTVRGLPAGADYTVCFFPAEATGGSSDAREYLGECYDSKPSTGAPTPVKVTSGATRALNAALVGAGAITGTVTDAGGARRAHRPHHDQPGLSNVSVSVESTSTGAFGYATTAVDGSYTVAGLAVGGDYRVCFTATGARGGGSDALGYLGQCWQNRLSSGTSTPVAVTLGATSGGINAVLATAGVITGRVSDAGGSRHGLADVSVHVSSASTGADRYAVTAADGSYTVPGLAAGPDYRVCFTAAGARGGGSDALGYLGQCYERRIISGTPTRLAVRLGATRTGVNAPLASAGAVSGRVSDAGGSHHGLADVSVHVSSATLGIDEFATTAADGRFTVSGLLAGTDYTVCFIAAGARGGASDVPGYVSQCWQNKATSATSAPVTVTLGATRTAINAALVGRS